MILDPYIVKAMSQVTAERLYEAFARLYPDYLWNEEEGWGWTTEEGLIDLAKWLHRARTTKPGLALSTGRTKSFRGIATCSLLDVMGVDRPKGPRARMDLAWDILDSPEGTRVLGHTSELDVERRNRSSRRPAVIEIGCYEMARKRK